MFNGKAKKNRRNHQSWNDAQRPQRNINKYQLAEPPDPDPPDDRRVIVVWGDGIFPTVRGNPAAPSVKLYQALKMYSRVLGVFPQGHALAGQRRFTVLKVDERYSSQIPSCWASNFPAHDEPNHPPLPQGLPLLNQRLQQVDDIFAVKQCPHCDMYWQRDVNACRNIGIIFFSLQQNQGRPAFYGAARDD
jgi:hypothetical protein